MKDYYELLEVNQKASKDTIKKVFRMLIKKNHPDLFEGDEKLKAEEKVKELNQAYEILINEESRNKYDIELEQDRKNKDNAVEILIEENEYLKRVIYEKNELIKEFLQANGIDTKVVENEDSNEQDLYVDENNNNNNNNNNTSTSNFNGYILKQKIKKIVYIILMMMMAAILLWILQK